MSVYQKVTKAVAVAAISAAGTVGASAEDVYSIDVDHSHVGFSVPHLGISKVYGRFSEFSGELLLEDGALAELSGSVKTASIDTDNAKRDEHLQSGDFFDVATFPEMTFVSDRVEDENGTVAVYGQLNLHGVTRELRIPVSVTGPVKDPWGNSRIGLEGKVTINRKDYGLSWNQVLEAGGLLVGEQVEIELRLEGILKS